MKYRIADLHCDTAYNLVRHSAGLKTNDNHISLDKAAGYGSYLQVMAAWGNNSFSDKECLDYFFRVEDNLIRETTENSGLCALCSTYADIEKTLSSGRFAFVPSVEDARLLCSDISNFNHLTRYGVRFLTLVWGGSSSVGGAHDTSDGLTPFGFRVLSECFERGVIPDVSHASEKTADEITAEAVRRGKPCVATHSNSYSVYPHSRNLRDRHFDIIKSLGGLVGVSLCVSHLSGDKKSCCVDDVVRHIDYYLSRGGEKVVCLGCDLDGTDLPNGFSSVADLYKIADALLAENYSEETVDRIMFTNVLDFCKRNF